jgi:hypothetical protein
MITRWQLLTLVGLSVAGWAFAYGVYSMIAPLFA